MCEKGEELSVSAEQLGERILAENILGKALF